MTSISQIIECIDKYLIRNNQTDITPVDANKILDQAGLLSDSKNRPGLPLRKLLRDGKIPHAYPIGNKWHIPHSKSRQKRASTLPASHPKPTMVISSSNKKSLPPLVGSNPTILILGTLPGDASLQKKQYYAKSGNRFWSIIAHVANSPIPLTYEEKKQLLFSHKIALWDVVHTADRHGSLDSDIRSELPNDLQKFLRQYPTIRTIAFNGQKAERLYNKYFAEQFPNIRHLTLRSSSPANRQFNDAVMIKDWKRLFWI